MNRRVEADRLDHRRRVLRDRQRVDRRVPRVVRREDLAARRAGSGVAWIAVAATSARTTAARPPDSARAPNR